MKPSSPQIPKYPSQNDKSSVSAQFGLTNTNTHGHSGAAMDGGQIDYNSLMNKPVITPSSYGGRVNSDASGIFPTGWTCTVGGSGGGADTYTVVHNLGTTSYGVVAFAYGASLPLIFLTYNANNFTVQFNNSGGTPFATSWNFSLTLIT